MYQTRKKITHDGQTFRYQTVHFIYLLRHKNIQFDYITAIRDAHTKNMSKIVQ